MTSPRNYSRIIAPLLALVGGALLLIGVSVYVGSTKQDTLAKAAEERALAHSLRSLAKRVSDNTRDNASWDDAIRHVVLSLDESWADENLGPYIHETFGYEISLVLDGAGQPVYGSFDGVRDMLAAASRLSEGALRIAQAAQALPMEQRAAAFGFVVGLDGTYAVAAGQIAVQDGSELAMPDGPRSTLIFAKRLDRSFLDELARELGLGAMHLTTMTPPADLASFPLAGVDGRAVRWIAWAPSRPGQEQISWLVPALLGSFQVFGGLAILILRNIRASTAAILDSEARFKDIAEAASDWIWETDAEMRLVYLSDACVKAMGLTPEQTLGRELHDLLPPVAEGEHDHAHHAALTAKAAFKGVLCRPRIAGGESRILRLSGKPVFDEQGELRGYRGTASDITSEMAALEQARYLAEHDALTGLPNRVVLRERLLDHLAHHRRYGVRGAVLCLDLDRFKEVNDSLGHGAGDALLIACTQRLRGIVRATDTVARLGGDEFAVLQTEVTGIGDVEQLCERIVRELAAPFDLDGHEAVVSVSIGVALVPDDGDEPGHLLQNADMALYRAKASGRDRFCFFEAGMDQQLRERKRLEADLRVAIATGQLEVHYQPQIDTVSARLSGVEGLLRWRHPERGLVSPGEFVPLAEEIGLIVPIGEWVLRTACRDARRWPGVKMSINVSPVQFRQRNLVEVVTSALAEAGLEPERLELEITEGLLLQNTGEALTMLERLKALGVRIAMDDFGTGYSSLSYLQRFPFDKIKIDKSFVVGLGGPAGASAIVRAIVHLGQTLNMRTCAEGVETMAQLDCLRLEGCEEIQGFLFGRPQTAAAIDELLASTGGILVPAPAAPTTSPATRRELAPALA